MEDRLSLWDYDLPPEQIARRPSARREQSRLMRIALEDGATPPKDGVFSDLCDALRPGDLLIANNTAVLRARLFGRRPTGGRVEIFLLGVAPGPISALARPTRRLAPGEVIAIDGGGSVTILGRDPDDPSLVRVTCDPQPLELMALSGNIPLPPYMEREPDADDHERYQTVYAEDPGSSAAPTAGLHFTPEVLAALRDRGVGWETVTLHVGLGTFRPLREEDIDRGELHAEPWSVPDRTAEAIAATRHAGGRVIAVGTTSVRTLASAAQNGVVRAGSGTTRIFLQPPAAIPVIDGLITNFHLPRSSLLMLVACLCGRERLLDAYRLAVARGYRFYSYGDAMLLL
jgi:S-adenosylmethionine:tRNA ribosyltransferase-isomerase